MSKTKIAHPKTGTKRTTKSSKAAPKKQRDETSVALGNVLEAIGEGKPLDPMSPAWRVAGDLKARIERAMSEGNPDYEEQLETMTGEKLAGEALAGYGDPMQPLAYNLLRTLYAEIDMLSEAAEEPLRTALFSAANRARIAAELCRRADKASKNSEAAS